MKVKARTANRDPSAHCRNFNFVVETTRASRKTGARRKVHIVKK